jgi:hypothetical protein
MGFCNEVPGTYVVKYHCQDKSGNEVSKFQTIYNEDHIIPIIHILGHPHMVLEATTTGNYVDDGAVCTDQIDGMISQNVEVSGDVVNLSKPGTYHIFYDCADSAGRIAHQRTRTVVVADCTCPTCDVFGDKIKTIEASFPYTDSEKANCTDSLWGSLDANVTSNWNTLNVEKTGEYLITYTVTDEFNHTNTLNQSTTGNQPSSYCGGQQLLPNVDATSTHYRQHVRTIHVVDTLKPVIALKYDTTYFHGDAATDTRVREVNPEVNPATGHHGPIAMAELNKPAVNGCRVDFWVDFTDTRIRCRIAMKISCIIFQRNDRFQGINDVNGTNMLPVMGTGSVNVWQKLLATTVAGRLVTSCGLVQSICVIKFVSDCVRDKIFASLFNIQCVPITGYIGIKRAPQ